MNLFFLLVIWSSFVFLAYHYISYMKTAHVSPGHALKKAAFYLFSGFVLLVSISNIFADAIFEILGLTKPANYEIMSFLGYCVFAAAIVMIFKNNKPDLPMEKTKETVEDKKSPPPQQTIIKQSHFGAGDIIAGDKIGKQINMGDGSTYIGNQNVPPSDKKNTRRRK